MTDTVSVIMPACNAERFVARRARVGSTAIGALFGGKSRSEESFRNG